MPEYDFQVLIHNQSNLPEDDCVNTLHFEVNAPDTLEGACDGIAAAYQSVEVIYAIECNGLTVKAYLPGPNPTGPVLVKDYTFNGNAPGGPPEVAVCLSYASVDDPEQSLPRRRGRIYLGPLGNNNTNTQRVSSGTRDLVLDLGEALASVGTAGNTTWLMRSASENVYWKIESIFVDDAWDTQRRRGLAPTLREVRDVQ